MSSSKSIACCPAEATNTIRAGAEVRRSGRGSRVSSQPARQLTAHRGSSPASLSARALVAVVAAPAPPTDADARVGDQDVQSRLGGPDLGGVPADLRERGKIG